MMQALYPIFSKAPVVPSWQTALMPDSSFDLDRIRAEMERQGFRQSDIAKLIGVNQSAISNIFKGKRRVKVEEALLIEEFLGITRQPAVQFIPVIGMTSAGNWREAILSPGGVMPVPNGVAGKQAFAVEVKGDSMDKIIPDGGFAVVDPRDTQLYNDKIYLIQNGDHETQVKLYRSNPARFEPVSTNETHRTILVGEEQVKVIGRVVWQGAPL